MLGLHRDVREDRTVEFEFLRIESGPDGITYWASPMGRPATPFRMSEQSERRVVFANPGHAYPARILYWIAADGALHARSREPARGRRRGRNGAGAADDVARPDGRARDAFGRTPRGRARGAGPRIRPSVSNTHCLRARSSLKRGGSSRAGAAWSPDDC